MPTDKAQSGASEPVLEPVDFIYENQKIRAFDDGENLWLVADDLAVVLGYSQANRLTLVIDEDEVSRHTVTTLRGPKELLTVSESGCYHAIMKSRKPGAQKFRRWITETVIPEIGRTGRYSGATGKDDRTLFAETSQAVRRMGSHVRAVAEQLALSEQELSRTRHHLTQVAEICENAVESDLRLHGLPQDRDIASPILSEVYNHLLSIMEGLKRTAYLRTGMCGDEETLQAFYDFIREYSNKKRTLATDEKPKTIQ